MAAFLPTLMLVFCLTCTSAAPVSRYGPKHEYGDGSNEYGQHHYVTLIFGESGAYEFFFELPDQTRHEQRNEDGEVTGSYSFVDPEGEKFSLQYLANEEGFQPTANHLPVAPEETEAVREAREAFEALYERTVQHLAALDSDEDSNESSEEDLYGKLRNVYGEEGDDEGSSSSESLEDDDDYDDDDSSEEDDESDEDDEEKEDEEDEAEESRLLKENENENHEENEHDDEDNKTNDRNKQETKEPKENKRSNYDDKEREKRHNEKKLNIEKEKVEQDKQLTKIEPENKS